MQTRGAPKRRLSEGACWSYISTVAVEWSFDGEAKLFMKDAVLVILLDKNGH